MIVGVETLFQRRTRQSLICILAKVGSRLARIAFLAHFLAVGLMIIYIEHIFQVGKWRSGSAPHSHENGVEEDQCSIHCLSNSFV